MLDPTRTIIIGDIHGCLEEFDELLKTVQYAPATDRLISVGDLLDRGMYSVGVVRRCRELDVAAVMGNHEYHFLRRWKGNKFLDARPYDNELNDDDVAYINRMPHYIALNDKFWITHAGVKPGVPIEKQKRDDLLFLRYTDKNREFLSLKKVFKDKVPAMFWTEFGPFDASVVYGHNVWSMDDVKIDKFDDGTVCYGIDTGCCFGGKLSALVLAADKEPEIVQVKAKEVYYTSKFMDL